MCQLFCVAAREKYQRPLVFFFLKKASKFNNKDGFGIFAASGKKDGKENVYAWYKHEGQASENKNISDAFIEKFSFTGRPIFAHVRAASAIFTAKKGVEHNHPFVLDNLILAHNGTLEPKEGKIPDNLIDSAYFAQLLSEERKTSDMITALKTTMGKFRGKFAMLIHDKESDEHFIIRGKSADLHLVKMYKVERGVTEDGKLTEIKIPIGYFVVTEKTTANDIGTSLQEYCQFRFSEEIVGEVSEIKKESINIFTASKGLIEVGEIKEEERPRAAVVSTSYTTYGTGYGREAYPQNRGVLTGTVDRPFLTDGKTVDEFLKIMGMGFSVFDLELISLSLNKTSIRQMTYIQIKNLIDEVFPFLMAEMNSQKHSGKIKKEWNKIVKLLPENYSQFEILSIRGLKFPFFYNELMDLRELKRSLIESKEKRTGQKFITAGGVLDVLEDEEDDEYSVEEITTSNYKNYMMEEYGDEESFLSGLGYG